MNLSRKVLSAAAALTLTLGASPEANAVFVARICNDLLCQGGDDVIVQDNTAGDSIPSVGAISFATSAFGYSLLGITALSKPIIGSAAAPQLDLSFAAASSASAGNVFLYASDTDFTTSGSFLLSAGGTNSGGSGTETARAWGGTSNTEFQFSGANLLGTLALSGPVYSGTVAGPFSSSVNPYSLTIGVTISRSTSGTSTGDLNLQVAAIPEPETYALMLAGLGLMGFAARRRKQ